MAKSYKELANGVAESLNSEFAIYCNDKHEEFSEHPEMKDFSELYGILTAVTAYILANWKEFKPMLSEEIREMICRIFKLIDEYDEETETEEE